MSDAATALLNGLTADAGRSALEHALPDLTLALRRHLHQHPELGFQEYATSRFIRATLERYGLTVHGPLADTGLYVDIEGIRPGPTVAYRADIDALPIQDAKSAPYASKHRGVAHLCGHDAHTTIALGVAMLLSQRRDDLQGTARIFFQPNEEGMPSGAPLMIRDGVLDGVSAAYAIHVDPTLEAGRFGLITGPATASADRFRICVIGPTTGHSARPHNVADTIWIATQILNTYYQLFGRITDARNAAVLTVCRFHGGEAYNVIPQHVEFGGTLRCTSRQDRLRFKHEIIQIAEQTAVRQGAQAEIEFDHGAPPVINDTSAIQNVRQTIGDLLGPEAVYDIPRLSMGAEDFAHYLEHVPGALVRVGTAASENTRFPLHDAHFDLHEAALAPAVRLMSEVLINHIKTT